MPKRVAREFAEVYRAEDCSETRVSPWPSTYKGCRICQIVTAANVATVSPRNDILHPGC
jgi:hypothetical protein